MEKRQLLFVTYRNESMREGVSYALELAKAMDEDIMILLVQRQAELKNKFDDLMTAVAFAEAGEHDTARQVGTEKPADLNEAADREVATVVNTCLRKGVHATVHASPLDALAGIRTFLKKQWGVDRVVLSPAITTAGEISSKDIKRLVRVISRPVVTMARQPLAAAGEFQKV